MKEKFLKRAQKCSIALGTILFATLGTSVLATSEGIGSTVDVTPPWGRIKIVGATQVNNVNYISRTEIEVEVYTNDDMCEDNEIKFYVSTDEINKTEIIPDNKWESYTTGIRKKITLPSTTSTNKIYAAFKDKTGNTTIIYEEENTQYNVVYNANVSDGSATMPTGMGTVGYYGMPFTVTTQAPEREGYYFWGWSTTPGANSASYRQGDIIPADVFIGADKTINLYAIWSTDTTGLPLLADEVKIGDYVNYPVYYDKYKGWGRTGWRVISKDIDLDGTASPGTVNLVSAGAILEYYNSYDNVNNTITRLTTKFLTTPYGVGSHTYTQTCFSPNLSLTEVFTNKYTEMYGTIPKVRSIMAEDILRVTGDATIEEFDGNDGKYEGLINGDYLIANRYSDYYIRSIGAGKPTYTVNGKGPVRAVVSLKPTVKSAGTDMIGAWEIEL